ncbi:MAG TPA: TetR/AcrR family transcriptional regulator [Pseudonocardiaceae bacterium]|nr:TetR/AcrR family transcriptional regulator [Pseudonocardiaceae bacterium]
MVKAASASKADEGWRVSTPADLSPILAHTLAAFEEQGYHGTSVRDIARRVGVTVPALYYHYENKQALLFALLTQSMEALLEKCEAALAETAPDPVAGVSALVECVVRFMAYRGSKGLLDSEIRSLQPENRASYIAQRDQLDTIMQFVVAAGVHNGVFRTEHPVEAARALLTMCHAVARWYHLDGELSPAELAERYVGFGLGLLGYKPPKRKPRKNSTRPGART